MLLHRLLNSEESRVAKKILEDHMARDERRKCEEKLKNKGRKTRFLSNVKEKECI